MVFDAIREAVGALEAAYQSLSKAKSRPGAVREMHGRLLARVARLALDSSNLLGDLNASAAAQADPPRSAFRLMAEWSDRGAEAGAGYVRLVELANRYDTKFRVTKQPERRFLLFLAAVEYFRSGRYGVSFALLRQIPEEETSQPMAILENAIRRFIVEGPNAFQGADGKHIERARDGLQNALKASGGLSFEKEDDQDWLIVLLVLEAFRECGSALRAPLVSGSRREEMEHWKEASNSIQEALSWSDGFARLGLRYLLMGIRNAIEAMPSLSIWNGVELGWGSSDWPDLVKRWAKKRAEQRPFMFPSQLAAIQDGGLFRKRNLMVSLPTGSGKSFLGELFALARLAKDPTSIVLYVVPSRALASEKLDEFVDSFQWSDSPIKVCRLTGEVAFNAEEALQQHNLVILTPEKLDILLRNNLFMQKYSAIVVDEFHLVREETRGIKLQLALKRFKKLSKADSLFISAIVPTEDFAALAKWATSEDPFEASWRPAISRIGIVDAKKRPHTTVEFNDGTTRRVSTAGLGRSETREARRRIVREFLAEDQVLHFSLSWRQPNGNKLLEEAAAYLEGELVLPPNLKADVRSELAARLRRLAGAETTLVQAFNAGIGVHWGELPYAARRIVEEATRRRALGLVISTTTLAEGVNLPFKTVFVERVIYQKRGEEFSPSKFLNLIGRAGRPFFHPEGQVVIAYEDRVGSGEDHNRAARYAKLGRNDVERIYTGAAKTADRLFAAYEEGFWKKGGIAPGRDWERIKRQGPGPMKARLRRELMDVLMHGMENLASSLLASIGEELIPGISHSTALREILFFGHEDARTRERVEHLLQLIENRLVHYGAVDRVADDLRLTAWGHVIYKTGFGPQTCEDLRREIKGLAESVAPSLWGGPFKVKRLTPEGIFFDSITSIHSIPFEFESRGGGSLHPTDRFLFMNWLNGFKLPQDYQRKEGAELVDLTYLDAVTSVESQLSGYMAWVFLACHLIAKHEVLPEPAVIGFRELAEASFYGHRNKAIRGVLKLDLSRRLLRDDLVALSPHIRFPSQRAKVSLMDLREFEAWLTETQIEIRMFPAEVQAFLRDVFVP